MFNSSLLLRVYAGTRLEIGHKSYIIVMSNLLSLIILFKMKHLNYFLLNKSKGITPQELSQLLFAIILIEM